MNSSQKTKKEAVFEEKTAFKKNRNVLIGGKSEIESWYNVNIGNFFISFNGRKDKMYLGDFAFPHRGFAYFFMVEMVTDGLGKHHNSAHFDVLKSFYSCHKKNLS